MSLTRRATLAALLAASPLAAQQSGAFDLTIKSIMRGPELYGRPPADVRWSPDGRWIYFSWVEPGTDWREKAKPYRVRPTAGARPERLARTEADSLAPMAAQGSETPDHRWRAVAHLGDLWLVDLRHASVRRLTDTRADESDPTFAADAQRIFFVRDDNVFSLDVQGGLVRQVTDVRTGKPPREDSVATGQRGFLSAQERALLEAVRDQLRADSIAKSERKARDSTRVKPLYLRTGEKVGHLYVSPDGKALLVETTMAADSARETAIPKYVTTSGYTEELKVRTKVGDAQEGGRLGYMRLPGGELTWLRVTPGDTVHPAAELRVYGWDERGSAALVSAVSSDFKTRWLHTVTDQGVLRTVDTLRDSAWVGSQYSTYNACSDCAGWYAGGSRLWTVTEADGYAHLYTMSADGSDRRQLTSGKWEITDVSVSRDGRWFWIQSSETSPFELHFWRMPVAGGPRERITTVKGANIGTPSPDGKTLAIVHSEANRPPELFVASLAPGAAMTQLTTSTTAEWRAYPWRVPEIVMIPASDGVQVPARIYRPKDFGATPNGAAVLFVHGAGYLHNVHNFWSTYSREYMFNHLLASRGYVVLDMDYRGSAGYGRDWRTAIYRHMGGRDLQDEVDGSRWLQRELGIKGENVGMYGGSYGGFMTLMALFTTPKEFGAGAALRSVTDWSHYNHGYTARILNTPQGDSIAFRRSSPIYFAEGLEDPLLMAHGMVDENVHFQDVVRLSQRLIELGKTRWELAVYPVEDHGFVRPSSWADEYRRIFALFEANLPARATAAAGGR